MQPRQQGLGSNTACGQQHRAALALLQPRHAPWVVLRKKAATEGSSKKSASTWEGAEGRNRRNSGHDQWS